MVRRVRIGAITLAVLAAVLCLAYLTRAEHTRSSLLNKAKGAIRNPHSMRKSPNGLPSSPGPAMPARPHKMPLRQSFNGMPSKSLARPGLNRHMSESFVKPKSEMTERFKYVHDTMGKVEIVQRQLIPDADDLLAGDAPGGASTFLSGGLRESLEIASNFEKNSVPSNSPRGKRPHLATVQDSDDSRGGDDSAGRGPAVEDAEEEVKCPPFTSKSDNYYPDSKCVYPQPSDMHHAKKGLRELLKRLSSEDFSHIPDSELYPLIRKLLIQGDDLHQYPRKYAVKYPPGNNNQYYQWDPTQDGRPITPSQDLRRINRFKYKRHLFESAEGVRKFFDISSNPVEKCVNAFIKYIRNKEEFQHDKVKDRRVLRPHFPPAHSFFHPFIRKKISDSHLYQVSRDFPKGAILHSHFWSLSSAEFMAKMMVSKNVQQEVVLGIGDDKTGEYIPEMTKLEKPAYDHAYVAMMADITGDPELWMKPGVWNDVHDVLASAELEKRVFICGDLAELIEGLKIDSLFDAERHGDLEMNDNTHTNCQIYEWKSGKAKAEIDGGSVPMGTMAFFPVNPNPKTCSLKDEHGECRELEKALFTTGANTTDALRREMAQKVDLGHSGKFAKMSGWKNLHDELQKPENDQRMRNAIVNAKKRAIERGILCPDGCEKQDHDAIDVGKHLEFFLDGDPFKIVLLSYFQMGYWDLHTVIESRDLWKKLEATWARTGNVAKFLPFFHMYVLDTVKRALQDNVQVIEARHKPGALYGYKKDAAGNWNMLQKLSPKKELELIDTLVSSMNKIADALLSHNGRVSNQLKLKVIAFERRIGQLLGGTAQASKLRDTMVGLFDHEIAKPCPEDSLFKGTGSTDNPSDFSSGCGMLAGFDIAGEEDSFYFYGRGSNRDVARHFLAVQTDITATVNNPDFRFEDDYLTPHHSGESNNAESYNMIDSYLTQLAAGYGEPDKPDRAGRPMRFGHGIMLSKLPDLEEKLLGEEKNPPNVLIEVNPISNQVLGYVPDLRNHPGLRQMRKGLAIALSFDDPSQFGYSDVSYDWYQAIAAWKIDLSDMKELALNSIAFSSLSIAEQKETFNLWDRRYHQFLEDYMLEAGLELARLDEQMKFDRPAGEHDLSNYMQPLEYYLRESCVGGGEKDGAEYGDYGGESQDELSPSPSPPKFLEAFPKVKKFPFGPERAQPARFEPGATAR